MNGTTMSDEGEQELGGLEHHSTHHSVLSSESKMVDWKLKTNEWDM